MQHDPHHSQTDREAVSRTASRSRHHDGARRPGAQLRGSNQSGMRAHNERLIMTLIYFEGALPRAELARRTGLSAQATSVIVRALQADGLLSSGVPIRGRVGQPSVPIYIDPQGAFFLGLHVGRRRVKLVLLDLAGAVVQLWHEDYSYPEPAKLLEFVERQARLLPAELGNHQLSRIAGLGVAIPFGLCNWADQAGAPPPIIQAWKNCDFTAELKIRVPWTVVVENDATAACNAEMIYGEASEQLHDFLYLYVDTFIGGGIVLEKRLLPGHSGNAGAIGSMLVPDGNGHTRQLIEIASLTVLEDQLREGGFDSTLIWRTPDDWTMIATQCSTWQQEAAHAIAYAIINACAVFDFDHVVLDGSVPSSVRLALVVEIRQALRNICSEGLALPNIVCGTEGVHAGVLGAAGLVLSNRFLAENKALTITPSGPSTSLVARASDS